MMSSRLGEVHFSFFILGNKSTRDRKRERTLRQDGSEHERGELFEHHRVFVLLRDRINIFGPLFKADVS